ncbi:polyamine aminopropyltransferase [Pseudoalteromonas rubra]|uniref:Polyamine aminopropyltransferase n=1 Tax=Pseudoalteromonas rubra TaxID=43658 RepID=A0A5S3UVI8_9GAMM|nr:MULTISPECIES: polyamine aminopropyltransferase [Pseudoalteromonas]QPB81559.1 polyamine aminopropyltransferase [Pseudoalteromonas rubra]
MTKINWHYEQMTSGVHIALRSEKDLVDVETEFQDVSIFETRHLGKVMRIDDGIQVTTKGEHIYHEMMAHVPILFHGNIKNVLIVGGGDGGSAREVLKHKSVENVVMVDIDEQIIQLSREFLPEINNGAFDDPRFVLRIGDGAEIISQYSDCFDLIILDAADPDGGASETLFTQSFFGNCLTALKADGILVAQGGTPYFEPYMMQSMVSRLTQAFNNPAGIYMGGCYDYFGGSHAFIWATRNGTIDTLSLEELESRFTQADIHTKYYSPEAHFGAFFLSKDMRNYVNQAVKCENVDELSMPEAGDWDDYTPATSNQSDDDE